MWTITMKDVAILGTTAAFCGLFLLFIVDITSTPTQQAQQASASSVMHAQSKRAKEKARFERERFFLAATMWGEARGEGRLGMGYVGHVIKNRASTGFRGKSIEAVVLRDRQFSCWNKNDPNHGKLSLAYLERLQGKDKQDWDDAKRIAAGILRGSVDYTRGALHYHTTGIRPFWEKEYVKVAVLKHHVFFR